VKTTPERVWWHGWDGCGAEVASDAMPGPCAKCGVETPYWEELGWRVGYGSSTYSWYSTYDHAMKDRRVK
jgi:hypothetical protein